MMGYSGGRLSCSVGWENNQTAVDPPVRGPAESIKQASLRDRGEICLITDPELALWRRE